VGRVDFIHVAEAGGASPRALGSAALRAGVGIDGDRYADGTGFWRDSRVTRALTLVEGEVLDDLRAQGVGLAPGELRRNITTRGVSLNDLSGRAFWIGDVLCWGAELCEPCRHLEKLTGQRLLRSLAHRGGLRARVLLDGLVSVGDTIEAADVLDGVGVIVARDDEVLLGRRLSQHGFGTWSFPGGKPLHGESVLGCGLRELREETGIEASTAQLVGETLDGFPESRLVFRTRFVEIGEAPAAARRMEPDKTEEWRWWSWSALPAPLFRPVASLLASGYRPGRR
jgi:ADP-ribose pyrophosphatase YjhB (NUDIX family)